jgi:hypothetical protein
MTAYLREFQIHWHDQRPMNACNLFAAHARLWHSTPGPCTVRTAKLEIMHAVNHDRLI